MTLSRQLQNSRRRPTEFTNCWNAAGSTPAVSNLRSPVDRHCRTVGELSQPRLRAHGAAAFVERRREAVNLDLHYAALGNGTAIRRVARLRTPPTTPIASTAQDSSGVHVH